MSDGGLPAGVGKTALGVAAVRAAESRRADRLFDDPYAEAFLAAAPGAFDIEQRAGAGEMASWGAAFSSHAVTRTRFFDDYLLAATAGGIGQVVLLAAGLDTRAFRLPWPDDVRLFELDLPDVLAFKERVLVERSAVAGCERTAIAVDLRTNWAVPLRRAGLATAEATAWLAEGLLIYLSESEAVTLLDRVGALSAAGSRVAFEVGGVLPCVRRPGSCRRCSSTSDCGRAACRTRLVGWRSTAGARSCTTGRPRPPTTDAARLTRPLAASSSLPAPEAAAVPLADPLRNKVAVGEQQPGERSLIVAATRSPVGRGRRPAAVCCAHPELFGSEMCSISVAGR